MQFKKLSMVLAPVVMLVASLGASAPSWPVFGEPEVPESLRK